MKFNIRGDKIEITQAINDYIVTKIGKLDKYLDNYDNIIVNVLAKVRGANQKIEVTINLNKRILRGEEEHKDLYAAIDLVSEKLERQLRKLKTKRISKKNKGIVKNFINTFGFNKDEKKVGKVVKRKEIEIKPMGEEEAILQLNLIDHDFFIYRNETNSRVCIIYKRKDKNYGIITLD